MLVIKDIILFPLILIPVLLLELIYKKDEESIISFSIICIGLILFRIFDFKLIGAILCLFGLVLMDSTYHEAAGESRKFSLKQFYGPFVSKYYYGFKRHLKSILKPLTDYNHFNLILKVVTWAYIIFWIAMIVFVSNFASHGDSFNFMGYLLVSVVAFVLVWYSYYRTSIS